MLAADSSDPETAEWIDEERDQLASSWGSLMREDIPTLVKILHQKGTEIMGQRYVSAHMCDVLGRIAC